MTKEELWQEICRQNPEFTGFTASEQVPVTMTPKGLRKFFSLVWDKAHDRGVENGKALAAKSTRDYEKTAADLLGGLFSGGKR